MGGFHRAFLGKNKTIIIICTLEERYGFGRRAESERETSSNTHLFVKPGVGHFVEPFAVRDVIVFLLGELEQYTGSRACHRVRSFVVHFLANGRGFLQVQLVAGRDQKRSFGQKMARVRQFGRTIVVVVVVAVPVGGRSPQIRVAAHLVRRRRQRGPGGGGNREFLQIARSGGHGTHITRCFPGPLTRADRVTTLCARGVAVLRYIRAHETRFSRPAYARERERDNGVFLPL